MLEEGSTSVEDKEASRSEKERPEKDRMFVIDLSLRKTFEIKLKGFRVPDDSIPNNILSSM